jgi:hypothetical protein
VSQFVAVKIPFSATILQCSSLWKVSLEAFRLGCSLYSVVLAPEQCTCDVPLVNRSLHCSQPHTTRYPWRQCSFHLRFSIHDYILQWLGFQNGFVVQCMLHDARVMVRVLLSFFSVGIVGTRKCDNSCPLDVSASMELFDGGTLRTLLESCVLGQILKAVFHCSKCFCKTTEISIDIARPCLVCFFVPGW